MSKMKTLREEIKQLESKCEEIRNRIKEIAESENKSTLLSDLSMNKFDYLIHDISIVNFSKGSENQIEVTYAINFEDDKSLLIRTTSVFEKVI